MEETKIESVADKGAELVEAHTEPETEEAKPEAPKEKPVAKGSVLEKAAAMKADTEEMLVKITAERQKIEDLMARQMIEGSTSAGLPSQTQEQQDEEEAKKMVDMFN